jgi:hypothetical protein
MLLAGTDLLALRLDEQDAGEFLAAITAIADMTAFVDAIWRFEDDHVGRVLDAIGRLHPQPRTAKAARRSAMKHRSHRAERRR